MHEIDFEDFLWGELRVGRNARWLLRPGYFSTHSH